MTAVSIPTPVTSNLTEQERFMQAIDLFIMTTTEGLCRLENQPGTDTQKEEFQKQKERILKEMDVLDKLVTSYRTFKLPALAAAILTISRSIDPPKHPA